MSNNDKSRLQAKQWSMHARQTRPRLASALASALQKEPSAIRFLGRQETNGAMEVFAGQVRAHGETEVPSRGLAITEVRSHIGDIRGDAFFFEDECEVCGAIQIAFEEALANLEKLLASQNESLRLMLADGTAGVCISSQEGSAAGYPRFITLWGEKGMREDGHGLRK